MIPPVPEADAMRWLTPYEKQQAALRPFSTTPKAAR
jgi:hypothetical protein